jgi:uncharacterized protein (TIGR00661 family)
MRILYGVAGEGMGHATRSRVFLEDLAREHEILIVASGRAHDYLAHHFGAGSEHTRVRPILGFSLAYEDNAIRRWDTVVQNLGGAIAGWPKQLRSYYEVMKKFDAEVVVSDFESFVLAYARRGHKPVVTVDNIMMLDRCHHDEGIVGDDVLDFELARQIARVKAPGAFHYVVPTFFSPPLRKPRTTLVPPVLRPEVLAARPARGEHLLVYQTATGHESLVRALEETGLPCRVYGVRRDLEEDVIDGHLIYRPFSETTFLDDLRSARGVIAGGGFSLLSECVYLRKPVLSIPVAGQFEQTLNARYLQRLDFGVYAPEPTAEAIARFLDRLPDCERALAGYAQDGNREALRVVRGQVELAATMGAFKARRAPHRRPAAGPAT